MKTVPLSDKDMILYILNFIRYDVPILMAGKSSIGKSYTILEMAKQWGLPNAVLYVGSEKADNIEGLPKLIQATQDIETTATRPDTQPTSNVAAIRPAQVSKPSTPLPSATPTEYTPPTVTAPPTTTTPTQTTPEQPDDEMMTEPPEDGIPELRDISDANEDKSELEESITYYSPVHKRYVTEALTY